MDMQHKRRIYPWQRWRRRVIIGCLLVFVLLPAVLGGITWHNEAVFEREIQAIRAKGFPATPADLEKSYPVPPKEQNAAETYQQSFQAQAKSTSKALYDDMIRQFNSAPKGGPMAAALHKMMSDYLEANAEALRLLHEVGGQATSHYPLDFSKGFGLSLPHLAKVRESVRLLQIEALVAAEDGDTNRALNAVAAALAVANSLRQEPVPISQLVRIACHGITLEAVKSMMGKISFSDEELVRLGGMVQAAEDPGAFTRAVAGERVLALTAFDHPEQILGEIPEVQSFGPAGVAAAAGLMRITGTADADRRRYLNYMDDIVTASQKPLWQAIPRMEETGQRLQTERSWLPSFTDTMLPAFTRIGQAFARDAASIAAVETIVAVERYRLANGSAVPGQVQDLVPAYLSAVPVDPFDGNPLRYHHDETGYAIYSVSEDLSDDGGVEAAQQRRGHPSDLVFRVDHAPTAAP